MLRRFFCIALIGGLLFSCYPSYAKEKSPVAAGCLSAFIPGVGQIYNGDTWKGVACLGGSMIASTLMFIPKTETTYDYPYVYEETTFPLMIPGLILGLGVWGFSIADAVITANKINQGKRFGLKLNPKKDGIGLALSCKF